MIHQTAIIDPSAKIGNNVHIGPYSIIGSEVEIGDGTWVGPHVVIQGPTKIGCDNKIYQFASLGESSQDKKFVGEKSCLVIGDRNVIREFTTFNRGTNETMITKIGNDNLFMAYVHIAHDCVVGNHTVFANNASLAGHVTIEDHVVLSGFVGVFQFCRVGAYSFAAGNSVIIKDVPPYIREVDMTVKPVPDTTDQVDVDYKVKEDTSAQATFSVGYSQVYRAIFGAGFNQKNFFGTGNTLGVNLRRSKYDQVYSIDYTDPYYTIDGISRSLSLSASRVDPRGAGVNNGYTTNEYDASVLYGIPVGQETSVINRVYAGFGVQDTIIYLIPGGVSQQINRFVTNHGTHIEELNGKIGYTRDGRDKAIMPTTGAFQTLFLDAYAPLAPGSVSFYTMNYQAKWYLPLINEFILLSKADLGFGSGLHGGKDFPFFRNYYAGGIAPGMGTVRGYQGYTLGPRDSYGKPFGGNILTDASIALIIPNHLSDSLRTSAFFDAGNVYSTVHNRGFGGLSSDAGPIRYSVGVEADWLTPFGPIEISLAQPLNRRPHDQRETFQFSMGANF